MRYHVVTATSTTALVNSVQWYLDAGYELVGGVAFDDRQYCQAVLKRSA